MDFKFRADQLTDLNERFTQSKKAVPVIAQRLLAVALRQKRNEMRGSIPAATGRLRRSFNYTARRSRTQVNAFFGFMRKRTSASTAIAAGVLQHPGARPKKGKYLWIPLAANRNSDGSSIINARTLLDSGGFIKTSKSGNILAFRRSADKSLEPLFLLKKFVQFRTPPLDVIGAGERAAEEVAHDLPIAIAAIIEAREKFIAGME